MKTLIARLPSAFASIKPVLLAGTLCLILPGTPARGDDDLRSLELYNGSEVEVVSGNRSPRPASQTAENITVITAGEIEALNAHTLADILYCVTGVQLEQNRTPGTGTNFTVQGSNFNHVLVLIDSVPINNLVDNFPDIGSVPVQMIERVEVVKGAASSSWGSALGGVINVITKTPEPERPYGGQASASFGTRDTADGRIEATGTVNRFGYYLTGGKLRSDGLLPNNDAALQSLYGKLNYMFASHGSLTFSTAFTEGDAGLIALPQMHGDQRNRQLISTLTLQSPLTRSLSLDASLRARRGVSDIFTFNPTETLLYQAATETDFGSGASVKLSWVGAGQRAVAGVDYDHVKTHLEATAFSPAQLVVARLDEVRRADRYGIYLIDTVTAGPFAITPSARFDHTGTGGDRFSPSFGITCALTDNSLLRFYTARGYSLTSLNRASSTEKVWTSQLGFETGEVPCLWLKGTLFRNDTRDVRPNDTALAADQRQLKQGVEFEIRTLPVYNVTLTAGYTFTSATEGDNGPVLHGIPKHGINIAIGYHDSDKLDAELTGHYIDWNEKVRARYGAILWDLHLRKVVMSCEERSLELFLSFRNMFDDHQYLDSRYQNAGRWGEAGVRCNF